MPRPLESIRNTGIIAHIDAGKTTTTERVLYYTKATHKMGSVDDGTTETDFDEEEAQRGITIYSAAVSCDWQGTQINIIDTPGHVDFTAEVERSLRVLDGAVTVFSAVEGVEAQSETVWRQADRYGVPRICFINKMDRIGASFERVFDEIRDRLACTPIAVAVPMGAESAGEDPFAGTIDLVAMKALYFDSESKGDTVRAEEIPERYAAMAAAWRSKLLDAVADLDEEAMETYLETDDLPAETVKRLLRVGTLERDAGQRIHPVFCGSSLDYIGVQPLLDGVVDYLPSPADVPPVEGQTPSGKKAGATETREAKPDAPLAGLVFKIIAEQHADLYFYRIYSGTLKPNSRLLNPRTGKKELVSQVWQIQASHRTKIDEAGPGEIVGLIGPKDAVTGDTLCENAKPVVLERITFPETVISMAVEPESSADRKKLEDTLPRLAKQDPTFAAKVSEDTGQTIISGMGELHLEVIKNRLHKDFNLDVRVHKPRVSYRETVKKAVTGTGTFDRQQEGKTQFAAVTVKLEPHQGDEPLTFATSLKPGEVPADLFAQLQDAIKGEAAAGGVVGYPLMNVRVTITDAKLKSGESTDVAIQAAAAMAVREALDNSDIALLEPQMKLEVVTPTEFLGAVQGDLQSRRALITNQTPRGDLIVLDGSVALSQMFGYSTQVRSLSQGRASYSMELLNYAEAPKEVLKEMLGGY